MDYSIRPFKMGDMSFLWEMLYQSIYIPEGQRAPSRDILKEQNIEKYLKNWGGAMIMHWSHLMVKVTQSGRYG